MFLEALAHPVDQGVGEQGGDQPHHGVDPARAEPTQCNTGGQHAEDEGPVTLAHRPVIAARRTDHWPEHAGVFAEYRQQRHQQHRRQAHAGDQRERQDQRAVGDDVAQFIEVGAQARLLAKFTREHAVDGVEGHAQDHPQRDQRKQPEVLSEAGDQQADQQGNHAGQDGDLVGGGAVVVEALHEGAQQVLKTRLELIDRNHGE